MAGLVFIGLFVFSAVFALGAFIFGHDADHDVGGAGHDVDHGGMPSIFSARVIGLFLLGFSSMGIIATYVWNLTSGYASLCGVGAGIVMGALAYAIVAMFYREQASSIANAEDYAGVEGRISTAIPEDGTGEVTLTVKGQLRTLFAVTPDGGAVPEGRPVKVINVSAGTAKVQKL